MRLLLIALLPITALAQPSLLERSPFLPPDFQRPGTAPVEAPPSPLDRLELRGITTVGGSPVFSIFDPGSSRGYWVGVNENFAGVTVSEFNDRDESLTVRSGPHVRTLRLKEARIVAMDTPPPPPQPAVMPPIQGGPPQENLSDEEVRERMQRVAEEIRRRRAMRRAVIDNAPETQ
jgi:hypothetical protein